MKPTNPTSLKFRDPPYHESWKYRVLVATLERLRPTAPEQHVAPEQQTAAPLAAQQQQQQHTAPRYLQHKARHTMALLSDLGLAPAPRLNVMPGAGAGAGVLT
ncbi:hypothetical protein LTR95_016965 [Oleoguttula sp. CCFEE 5521]